MIDLVIARYEEPLDWLLCLPNEYRVHVFNKGSGAINQGVKARLSTLVALPNVGRESETYLQYLSQHRSVDTSHIVFAQGDPFEHSPDFIEILNGWQSWGRLEPLSWCWKISEETPPESVRTLYGLTTKRQLRIRPEVYSLMSLCPLAFFDRHAYQIGTRYRELHQLPLGCNLAAHFLQLCGLDFCAEVARRHQVGCFSYGGLFAVASENLQVLTPDLIDRMKVIATSDVIHGFMFERLWLHMFGQKFYAAEIHAGW